MIHLSSAILLLILPIFCVVSGSEERTAPFMEYVSQKNYPVEEHFVVTEDGYILRVFRISTKGSNKMNAGSKPVLLQHGINSVGEVFFFNEERLSIGFSIANSGYDVWVGNTRGNRYSRNHTTLNPDTDDEFWNFSFSECGKYDSSAVLQYIAKATGSSNIDYVGFSQGTTQMFAALSEGNPTVLKYIGKFIAVGPAAYMKHASAPSVKVLGKIDSYVHVTQHYEKLPVSELSRYSEGFSHKLSVFCEKVPKICLKAIISGENGDVYNTVNIDRFPIFVGHMPSGTSLKSTLHYIQLSHDSLGRFRKFDYGKKKNIEIYGSDDPPVYDLSKINKKVHLIVGTVDKMATIDDAMNICKTIPDCEIYPYHEGHCSLYLGKKEDHIHKILEILSS